MRSAYFDSFTLEMSEDQARGASHQGQCDDDVAALVDAPNIARQLDAINPQAIARELREYGAWGAEELADDAANRARIVWIAAGNIVEEMDSQTNGGS